MKVLYISSNHANNATLMAEEEITELQTNSTSGAGRKIDFVFLPALALDQIQAQLSIYRPDIIHISAHGEKKSLEFVDSAGNAREVTKDDLRTLFSTNPPRLVFLNACNSDELASHLSGVVEFAIGTTAPISNYAARKGAVAFYHAIGMGRTLMSAFEISRSMVRLLDKDVSTEIFKDPSALDQNPVLYEPLRVVAHFVEHEFESKKGTYWFEIGLIGCPASTMQVVFCTNDKSYLSKSMNSVEADLCSVVLDIPANGEVWVEDEWSSWGDIRIFALAITPEGYHVSASASLIEALVDFYRVYLKKERKDFPKALQDSLSALRHNDGSRMRPATEAFGKKTRGGRKD